MTHGSLFSGIGGFDLAAKWMGWENVFHCERDPFCQKVLAHHFPHSNLHDDVTTFEATQYHGRIDVLSGGFPCQPFSVAGKRKGTNDARHLWPEMLRVIREIQPRYVIGENVFGLLNWSAGMVFEQVCSDLEAEGYEVTPFILPACGVHNAPHRRDRIWFIAHAHDIRTRSRLGEIQSENGEVPEWNNDAQPCDANSRDATNTDTASTEHPIQTRRDVSSGKDQLEYWENFPTVAAICGGNDGIPEDMVDITFPKWRTESIKAFGNAIVPQVALQIFRAISETDSRQ